jgi:hypothetical protein
MSSKMCAADVNGATSRMSASMHGRARLLNRKTYRKYYPQYPNDCGQSYFRPAQAYKPVMLSKFRREIGKTSPENASPQLQLAIRWQYRAFVATGGAFQHAKALLAC